MMTREFGLKGNIDLIGLKIQKALRITVNQSLNKIIITLYFYFKCTFKKTWYNRFYVKKLGFVFNCTM